MLTQFNNSNLLLMPRSTSLENVSFMPLVNEVEANSDEKVRKELQPISAKIEKDLYKQVKVFSIEKEIRFNDLIEDALSGYLEKHK